MYHGFSAPLCLFSPPLPPLPQASLFRPSFFFFPGGKTPPKPLCSPRRVREQTRRKSRRLFSTGLSLFSFFLCSGPIHSWLGGFLACMMGSMFPTLSAGSFPLPIPSSFLLDATPLACTRLKKSCNPSQKNYFFWRVCVLANRPPGFFPFFCSRMFIPTGCSLFTPRAVVGFG